MELNNWIAIIAGAVALASGYLTFKHRGRLARVNADAQRAFFGKAGEATARNSTPRRVGGAGIGGIIVGFIIILEGLLRHPW